MVNEIKINEIKQSARELEYALRNKHARLMEKDTEASVLNDIRKYVIKLQDIRLEENIEDVDKFERKYDRIKREVEKKYGVEIVEKLPVEPEPVEVVEVHEPTQTIVEKRRGFGFGALALAALVGLGAGLGLASCDTKQNVERRSVEETVETSENELDLTNASTPVATPVVTPTANPTANPTESAEVEEAINLVLGEYGTFLDINNEEQVEARANYIYNTYFAPIMDSLKNDPDSKLVTPENIANTIRVMNGRLPLDSEGNKVKDGATTNDYAHMFETYVVNIPSSDKLNGYYHIPTHLFTADGTELSEFMKSYDNLYAKMIGGLNNNDDVEVQDAIACLGYKFWNEWYLQGMYEGANPHNFNTEQKYFAAVGTWLPYGTTATESNLNQKRPVCIEACFDYETGEKRTLSVDRIWQALLFGDWNFVTEKLTGVDEPNIAWLPLYYQALEDQLNFEYDHLNTLKLN